MCEYLKGMQADTLVSMKFVPYSLIVYHLLSVLMEINDLTLQMLLFNKM